MTGFDRNPPGWYRKRTGSSLLVVSLIGAVYFSLPGPDQAVWKAGLSLVAAVVGYRTWRSAVRRYGGPWLN